MNVNFSNGWKHQGYTQGNILNFTIFRVWACNWSWGIEFFNFGIELELCREF
jgi:hypothetical protein